MVGVFIYHCGYADWYIDRSISKCARKMANSFNTDSNNFSRTSLVLYLKFIMKLKKFVAFLINYLKSQIQFNLLLSFIKTFYTKWLFFLKLFVKLMPWWNFQFLKFLIQLKIIFNEMNKIISKELTNLKVLVD